MSSFLASRGVLFTAWGVVALVVIGGLTLAYVQPPPPPGAEAVTVAVLPAPPVPASESMAQPLASDDPPQAGQPPSQEATKEAAPAEAVSIPLAPETDSSEPAAAGEPTAETTATAEMAPPPGAVATALPKPKPEAVAPQEPDAGPPENADSVAVEQSAPAPEASAPEAPAPEASAPEASTEAGGEMSGAETSGGTGPGGEQVVAIPLVPPAPEEMPYWERYRQPFNLADPRPRIAVVLTGLGLSDSATEAAITKLPSAVTLSFSPYARDLERWIALARSRGHEVMLDLPMEPATFPNEDPGPQGLLTSLTTEDNLDRLDWVLSRGSAYVGLAGSMGSRFTASRPNMEPILSDVKKRGLIFLDRRTTENSVVAELGREIGLPTAVNNRSVDERQASRVAIDARLAQIERIALTDGFAVAMAQPYPVTLDRLAEWATELTARGFAIAPISALADQQKGP